MILCHIIVGETVEDRGVLSVHYVERAPDTAEDGILSLVRSQPGPRRTPGGLNLVCRKDI
jgi:hypothetical protein